VTFDSHLAEALAGRYRLEREIGRGGMATVYLATDLRHARQVALKVLKPALAQAIGPERFLQEIRVTANLNHPNILPLFDSGQAGDALYYVMPYAEGETLRARLSREKQLAISESLKIGAAVARALEHAHRRGVIHRDIKPENILLQEGQPVVADFGIAVAVAHAGGERLTETGVSIGTPQYMSPEQAAGDRDLDARSDVYSLGCVLYEMLAGSPPHEGATVQAVIARILTERPRDLGAVRDSIPTAVAAAVGKALERVPADRYASAAELADELERHATGPIQAGPRQGPPRGARARIALVTLTIVMAVGLAGWLVFGRGTTSNRPIDQLAVLPLENLMGDSMQYFVAGMHDALIGQLARINGLAVRSRTSVQPYAGSDKPAGEIARELGVDAVVEGSLFSDGRRIRIQAELIGFDPERHLWNDSYDRDLGDVLKLQSEVTRAIAQAIRARLTPQDEARLANRRTVDPAAYSAYLRGRYLFSQLGNPEQDSLAFVYLHRAVALDSTFALAYAGLADAWAARGFPRDQALDRARRLARRALDLDSTLAEPWTTLGGVRMWLDWDWEGSADAFERSIAMNPSYAQGHQWYAELLAARGRGDSAIAEARRAEQLDPRSPVIAWSVGRMLYFARRFEEAKAQFQRVLELNPDLSMAHLNLSSLYWLTDRPDSAIRSFLAAVRANRGGPRDADSLAALYRREGATSMWRAAVQVVHLNNLADTREVAFMVAGLLLRVGRRDAAMDVLEQARADHAFYKTIPDLVANPTLDPLREEPRFQRLLAGMGLGGENPVP